MKNLALIVAGGSGLRVGGEIPKQYLPLGGKAVLRHTVEAFLSHPEIEAVRVVIGQGHGELYNGCVVTWLRGYVGLLEAVTGGKERQDSVRLGLESVKDLNPENVLIHDAARPFVSAEVISRVLDALREHEAVIPAVLCKDSVRVDGAAIPREKVRLVQTPQGFHYKKILHAHQHNMTHWVAATDDAHLAEAMGMNVFIVEGDEMNKKITTQADLSTINHQPSTRVGFGFDVHEFTTGTHVMICGVKVLHSHGLKGHSDADVGLHALVDALLGAIGEGDIGQHFPPSDPEWKDADSEKFTAHAAKLVKEKGGVINNVDITIIGEEPKVGPHRAAMKANVARILAIEPDRVNIKATTTEGLGFTGRKEGLAAQAVASVLLG